MNIKFVNTRMIKQYQSNHILGDNVRFCVIDSGVSEVGYLRGKVEYADDYKEDQLKPDGHGTFVASELIRALPNARIISYCVFPNGKGNNSLINLALKDVLSRAKNNPELQYFCNMSLACTLGTNRLTSTLRQMERLIIDLNDARVPVYVAAGNDSSSGDLKIYPSRFESPVCIAGIDDYGESAPFSTFHEETDFCEEAINVIGLYQNGRRGIMSGTSMACPMACAKAALFACKIKKETSQWPSEMELYNMLRKSVIDLGELGRDDHYGYGFIRI